MPKMRDLYKAAQGRVEFKATRTVARRFSIPIVLESVTTVIDGSLVGYAGEASWDITSALCHGYGPQGGRAEMVRMLGL